MTSFKGYSSFFSPDLINKLFMKLTSVQLFHLNLIVDSQQTL